MNNVQLRIIAYTYRPSPASSQFTAHSSLAAPYSFSAKERDMETGLSYFGARYYSSDLSVWLSVDPMSDKYPSFSPYAYCRNNPIILYDPNGMFDDWVEDKNGHIYWDDNATSQETTKPGETYLGKSGQRTIGNDVWNYHSDGTTDEQRAVIISEHNDCDVESYDNNSTQDIGNRLNDIFYGSALVTTLVGEACKSASSTSATSGEVNIGKAFNIGGKITQNLGRAMGTVGIGYTFYQANKDGKITMGEGMRIGIQTASVITSFIPGYGSAISLGLTAVDAFLENKIEKIGSKH